MDKLKESTPSDLMHKVPILVDRKPDEKSFSHNMVLRDKTPIAGVKGIVAVVAHHEVIVLMECVLSKLFTIDE